MKHHREIKNKSINELIPYANNAKTHPEEQVTKIASSIHQFGFNTPIVIDQDNVVIAGHGRLMAAKKLGLEEVPCVIVDDLDEYQRMAYRIADNKVAESEWDNDFLKFDLGTLSRNNFDFKLTGFSDEEVDKILNFNEIVELVNKGDENEAWVGMPNFDPADKEIKITLIFKTEEEREAYKEKNDLNVTKISSGQWTVRL